MKEQNQIQQNHLNSFRIKGKSQRSKQFQVEHYQIGELIGKGGFANVHKAVEMYTKVEVAVKIVDTDGISELDLDHLRREVLIHTKLNHRNIVKIYQTVWTQTRLYIFMELVKGQELYSYLNSRGAMPEGAAAKIFSQIVDAARYMHDLNIAHRDIKTQNIIIDSDFNAKLIDFGLAKIYNSQTDDYLQTFCGSPSYVAPELIQNKRYHGQRVDIWCLGVTLYTMIQACLPFDGLDARMRQNNICHLNWHKPLYSSRQAIQIYNLIFKKQNGRIQLDQLLTTSFFSKHRLTGKINSQKKGLSYDYFSPSRQQELQKVIAKVCSILDVEQGLVRTTIKNKIIGQIYCVFQILWTRRKYLNQYQKKRKQSRTEEKAINSSKQNFNTIQPKSLKKSIFIEKQRPKSRQNSSFIRVLPVISDQNHAIISTPSKPQKQFGRNSKNLQLYNDKYKLDIVMNKDEVAKDILKTKAQKFKNIFTKDLAPKQVKYRLREDSPDSPKRILDCVKIYN